MRKMYTMGTVLHHGSEELKHRFLPEIAAGRLRLQAFGDYGTGCGIRYHAHPDHCCPGG